MSSHPRSRWNACRTGQDRFLHVQLVGNTGVHYCSDLLKPDLLRSELNSGSFCVVKSATRLTNIGAGPLLRLAPVSFRHARSFGRIDANPKYLRTGWTWAICT